MNGDPQGIGHLTHFPKNLLLAIKMIATNYFVLILNIDMDKKNSKLVPVTRVVGLSKVDVGYAIHTKEH
jgi:cytochrome c oxidase assembly factor CtaG